MVKKEDVVFIEGTAVAVRAYSITDYKPHWHSNCIEVIFVLKGKAHVMGSYDRFDLQAGEWVVMNEGDIHYLHSDCQSVIVSLYIDLLYFQKKYPYIKYLYFICESADTNHFQEENMQELSQLLVMSVLEAAAKDRNLQKVNENMERIIELLIYKFDMVHYYNGKDIHVDQLDRYHRIVKKIEESYGEKISLEDLAEKEFIGKNYISQFWKKMTGMNFTEYLNSRRCEMAQKLLMTTDKSVNEISVCCGFSDPKYIYKSFRKWYESTPSELKNFYANCVKRGDCYEEYDGETFLQRYGRDLMETFLDEEKVYLLRSASFEQNWRKKYELQVRKISGSKMRKEILRERHHDAGIKELYLPLLDKNVISVSDGELRICDDFIKKVFDTVRDLQYLLFIEIYLEERTITEWETVAQAFIKLLKEYGGKKIINQCRINICFFEFEKHGDIEKLISCFDGVIDCKNIKPVLRFN